MLGLFRTLGLAIGLMGALVASQAPEFSQQYGQRLGGALDEMRRVVGRFDADAAASGQGRDGAIVRMEGDADRFIRDRGAAARGDAERLERLERQRNAFEQATGPLSRLFAILQQPDPDLSRATYRDYKPAVPATEEGVLTAAIGFFLGWGLFRLLASGSRRLAHLGRRRRPVVA